MTVHHPQNIDPIFALMVAVVQRALRDLKSSDLDARRRTIQWFTSEKKDYIFSYLAIKEFLGLEMSGADAVAEILKEISENPCYRKISEGSL